MFPYRNIVLEKRNKKVLSNKFVEPINTNSSAYTYVGAMRISTENSVVVF